MVFSCVEMNCVQIYSMDVFKALCTFKLTKNVYTISHFHVDDI